MSGTKKPCPRGPECRFWQRDRCKCVHPKHTVGECKKALLDASRDNKSLLDKLEHQEDKIEHLEGVVKGQQKIINDQQKIINDLLARLSKTGPRTPHRSRVPPKTGLGTSTKARSSVPFLPRGELRGQFLSPDAILSSDALRRCPE